MAARRSKQRRGGGSTPRGDTSSTTRRDATPTPQGNAAPRELEAFTGLGSSTPTPYHQPERGELKPWAKHSPTVWRADSAGWSPAVAGRRFPFGALLLALAGGVLLVGTTAYVVSALFARPVVPREKLAPTGALAAPVQPGALAVSLPPGVPHSVMRVSLHHQGEIAMSRDGKPVKGLEPARLATRELEPGVYVVRMTYRGSPVPDAVADIRPGVTTLLQLSAKEMANVEYQAGLVADAQGGDAGMPYFRRVLRFNPDHVDAHLQLAAYELLHGSAEQVKQHLAAARRMVPDSPEVADVERLLRQRLRAEQ